MLKIRLACKLECYDLQGQQAKFEWKRPDSVRGAFTRGQPIQNARVA